MNIVLRVFGIIGFLIFGMFFYFTYSVPGYVEEVGKEFIKSQVQKEVSEKIDAIKLKSQDGKLSRIAAALYKHNQEIIERTKKELQNKLHEKLALAIAQMRDLDCECREKYSQMFKRGFEFQIDTLQKANERLTDFIKVKYMKVSTDLKRDIRIFTGSNALVFLFLLIASFLKPRAVKHLFLPAILLSISTIICSYFYIFEQNWLYTIIYNDYLGFGYLVYLGALFLILSDIVFNKAAITTEIINGILGMIGSAVSLAPC